MTEATREANRLATVFGGSGFLGRYIVRALVHQGWRIRVAVRRPDLARFPAADRGRWADPAGPGQSSLSGVDRRGGRGRKCGRQCHRSEGRKAGRRPILPCTSRAPPRWREPHWPRAFQLMCIFRELVRTRTRPRPTSRARGSAKGRRARPSPAPSFCVRPSCLARRMISSIASARSLAIFRLCRCSAAAETRLQPVYVGDVGQAVAAALSGVAKPGVAYELGGPRKMTLREAAELTLHAVDRRRLLIGLPLSPSRWIASSTQFASKATFGLFPSLLMTTRDQVDLLASDNVVSADAEAEGRVLSSLGIVPQAAEAIIPSYLARFRRTGRYEVLRSD